MVVYIHAQHTACAGTRYLGNRNGDMPDDDCDDFLIYEGTEEELLAYANNADLIANQSGAGTNVFWRRIARAIREAIS